MNIWPRFYLARLQFFSSVVKTLNALVSSRNQLISRFVEREESCRYIASCFEIREISFGDTRVKILLNDTRESEAIIENKTSFFF